MLFCGGGEGMNGNIRYGHYRDVITEACKKAAEQDPSACFCTHTVEMEAKEKIPSITTSQVSAGISRMYKHGEVIVLSMKSPCKYLQRAHDFYRLASTKNINNPTPESFAQVPKVDVTDYNAVIKTLEAEIAKLDAKKTGLEQVVKTLKGLMA